MSCSDEHFAKSNGIEEAQIQHCIQAICTPLTSSFHYEILGVVLRYRRHYLAIYNFEDFLTLSWSRLEFGLLCTGKFSWHLRVEHLPYQRWFTQGHNNNNPRLGMQNVRLKNQLEVV
jgi:hypothetical protein